MTDFEMTFTGDFFKVAWENNDVFKFSIPQKKFAAFLSKIQISNTGLSPPSC